MKSFQNNPRDVMTEHNCQDYGHVFMKENAKKNFQHIPRFNLRTLRSSQSVPKKKVSMRSWSSISFSEVWHDGDILVLSPVKFHSNLVTTSWSSPENDCCIFFFCQNHSSMVSRKRVKILQKDWDLSSFFFFFWRHPELDTGKKNNSAQSAFIWSRNKYLNTSGKN